MTRKRAYAEAFHQPSLQHQQHAVQPGQPKGGGKKGEKGDNGKGGGKGRKGDKGDKNKVGKPGSLRSSLPGGITLSRKIPDGRDICYNFGKGSCTGSCNKVHCCQLCFDTNHGYPTCPKIIAAGGMRT